MRRAAVLALLLAAAGCRFEPRPRLRCRGMAPTDVRCPRTVGLTGEVSRELTWDRGLR